MTGGVCREGKRRVLVADDHRIIRQGLIKIMEPEPDMEVCGEAESAAELLRLLRREEWDVLILDLALPDRSGLEVLGEAVEIQPGLKVVVLSMHGEAAYVRRAMREEAMGYVTKDRAAAEMVLAVREVLKRGEVLQQRLGRLLRRPLRGGRR